MNNFNSYYINNFNCIFLNSMTLLYFIVVTYSYISTILIRNKLIKIYNTLNYKIMDIIKGWKIIIRMEEKFLLHSNILFYYLKINK